MKPCGFVVALLLAAAAARLLGLETADDLRRRARQNLITIPVQLNGGIAVPFVLDSGATSTIVNESVASRLRLKQGKTAIGHGAGNGACIVRELPGVRIRTGDVDVASSVFAAPLEPLERFVGTPVNGIVGASLFLNSVVAIDYRARNARILEPKNFVPKPGDERIAVARSGSLCCIADAEIEIRGSRRRARLLIDTGALPFEIVLTRRFAALGRFLPDTRSEMLAIPGLCGSSRMAANAGIVYVRGLAPASVTVFISSDRNGMLASADFDGVIGSEFLRRFGAVVFDGRNGRVLLRSE